MMAYLEVHDGSKLGHFASVCRGEKNVLAATVDLDSLDDYDVTRDLGEIWAK